MWDEAALRHASNDAELQSGRYCLFNDEKRHSSNLALVAYKVLRGSVHARVSQTRLLSFPARSWHNILCVHAGNRSTKLLVGIQVQPHQEESFAAAQEQLAADYTFEELSGKARQVFMMFIS